MVKNKSYQGGVSRKVNSNKSKDSSTHLLTVMVILVLLVSVISVGVYVYAFYGTNNFAQVQKSQLETPIMEERGAVSGKATMQIIKSSKEKAVQ